MIDSAAYAKLVAVILSWMVQLQPAEQSPSRAAWYGLEASAIAKAAIAHPVFDTPLRTAAIATATAFFESGFDPNAMGDCDKGKPRSVKTCRSFGAFQLNKSYARVEVLLDVEKEAPMALRLMEISVGVCRAKKPNEKLGHYASGGAGCRGLAASRHRMDLGFRLEASARKGDISSQ